MAGFRSAVSPSFDMVTSEKSRGDSTWTMDDSDEALQQRAAGIAAMPAIEPLQEAHVRDEGGRDGGIV